MFGVLRSRTRLGVAPHPERLKRVRGGTLPGVRLEEAFPPAALDPAIQQTLDAYFTTFNAGDEEGHMHLFDPDVAFFGSMSRIDSFGHATVRGVFHAARTSMGVHHLSPAKTYGRRHELAVLVSFTAEDSAVPPAEGVWAFRFSEKALIDRLSVLWNPAYFPKG